MQCPRCQYEAPSDAQFCPGCGAEVGSVCALCRTINSQGYNYCRRCGQSLTTSPQQDVAARGLAPQKTYTPKHLADKILTSRSSLEGERKQVTVLFCDVVDSSRLAERLDPEAMHQLMDRAFRFMAEAVHRYEGTVNQFLGDGLMALFGAPVAIEEHALRAVLAALAIQETLNSYNERLKSERGVEVRLRLGINTGLVVVGRIGEDLRMDYTAVGDTTHLASRVQDLCEPGSILITETTRRLVDGYVRSEALGQIHVKGHSAPVSIYRIIGRRRERTRFEIRAEHGLTRLIGRTRELRVLRDCLDRVKEGQGQVVGIVGEAGLGKSRLLYEFRKSLAGEHVVWLEGHSAAYGWAAPYTPILEILRANFHVEDGDNPLQIVEKLRHGIRRLDLTTEDILPFLGELFVVSSEDDAMKRLSPKDKRQKTFEAILALTVAGAQRRPHVVVVEDLHWIDKTSEDCLAFAVEGLAAVPVLLLTTHRPGYSVRWADKAYYAQIPLGLLTERETAALMAELLGSPVLASDLTRLVWEKAEGNPLFIEEITTALLERGILVVETGRVGWTGSAALDFPESIQAIIRARLDRLDEPVKRAAQTAAVIGREFGLTLLTHVCEDADELPGHLETLKRVEFIHEKRLFPELEYMFKHAVIQDVAYQTLLLQRRKELHGVIGSAIEKLYAGRLEEHAPVLAYHYARSERLDGAIQYALVAGDRAAQLYANAEATAYYEQALAMVRKLSPSVVAQRTEIDTILRLAAVGVTRQDVIERDRKNLETARALAETLKEETRLARVLYWLGRASYVQWQPSAALEYTRRSLEIAERLGDDALAAPAVNLMGRIYWQQSEYAKASHLLARSAEQTRRSGDKTEESTAASFAGFALGFTGEFDRARAYADHGLRLAREIQNPFAEAAAYMYRGTVLGARGEWAAALADLANAQRIAQRIGDVIRIYFAKTYEGLVLTRAGSPTQARVLLEEAEVLGAQTGTKFGQAWQKAFLAYTLHALGAFDAVPILCQTAIQLAEDAHDQFPNAFAHRTLGEALFCLNPSEIQKAEGFLRRAIHIQEEVGNRPELARSYVSYARLLRSKGDSEGARELLTKAVTLFRTMGMAWDLEQISASGLSPLLMA